jgi:myosin heavy subunit
MKVLEEGRKLRGKVEVVVERLIKFRKGIDSSAHFMGHESPLCMSISTIRQEVIDLKDQIREFSVRKDRARLAREQQVSLIKVLDDEQRTTVKLISKLKNAAKRSNLFQGTEQQKSINNILNEDLERAAEVVRNNAELVGQLEATIKLGIRTREDAIDVASQMHQTNLELRLAVANGQSQLEISQLKSQLDDAQHKNMELKKQAEQTVSLSKQLDDERKKNLAESTDLATTLDQEQLLHSVTARQLEDAQKKIIDLTSQLDQMIKSSEQLAVEEQKTAKQHMDSTAQLKKQLSDERQKVAGLTDRLNSTCELLSRQLDDKRKEIFGLETELNLKDKGEEVAGLAQQLSDEHKNNSDLALQVSRLEAEKRDVSKLLSEEAETAKLKQKQLDDEQGKNADLMAQVSELTTALDVKDEEALELKKQRDDYQESNAILTTQVSDLKAEKAEFWQAQKSRDDNLKQSIEAMGGKLLGQLTNNKADDKENHEEIKKLFSDGLDKMAKQIGNDRKPEEYKFTLKPKSGGLGKKNLLP